MFQLQSKRFFDPGTEQCWLYALRVEHYSDLTFAYGRFDRLKLTTEHLLKHDILLPEKLLSSSSKRIAEFLAGRIVANYCMSSLASDVLPISQDPNGAPLWTDNYIGSISHSDNQVLVVTTKQHNKTLLGIDIEPVVSPNNAKNIARMILTPQEHKLFHSTGWSFHLFCTLVFSAKESIYKAFYPIVKHYFGFQRAELGQIDIQQNLLFFTVTLPDNDYIKVPVNVQVRYFQSAKFVFTCSTHLGLEGAMA